MAADFFTIFTQKFVPSDPRLKRHVHHDSRSLNYLAPEASATTLTSHKWDSAIPTLDQGQAGSCTGNAATKALSYADLWLAVKTLKTNPLSTTDAEKDEKVAISVYSDAEDLDGDGPYPPNDNGSSGLSVAKVVKTRGLIAGYTHAASLLATQTALQKCVVITGVSWHEAMYDPSSTGEIKPTGSIEGGHEFVLDEIDMELKRIWMQNSWGSSWGVDGGRAWFSFDAYDTLLHDSGDVTVFTPLTKPAPVPTPVVITPEQFEADALAWAAKRHTSKDNVLLQKQIKAYYGS